MKFLLEFCQKNIIFGTIAEKSLQNRVCFHDFKLQKSCSGGDVIAQFLGGKIIVKFSGHLVNNSIHQTFI